MVTVVDGLSEVRHTCVPLSQISGSTSYHFDGTTVRVYVNGKEQIETEVEEQYQAKEVFEGKIREKFA